MRLKGSVETGILATSALGIALLAISGLGFMQPSGEMSKLLYNSDMWCVSNYIEKEPLEVARDGRPVIDPLLSGKEDWIVRDQVKADSKEEAETKATRAGLFDPSDKTQMRDALARDDKNFFTHHFNAGATVPGPCIGTGEISEISGRWVNDMINEDCFGLTSNYAIFNLNSVPTASSKCGATVPSLLPSVQMVDRTGKLGHEEHLSQTRPSHYIGPDSAPTSVTGGGAFAPHTTEQERWYISSQWPYFDWQHMRMINNSSARQIAKKIRHARLVIKSVETGRTMIVSAEEAGPAWLLRTRDGVTFGAPPEVYRYLKTSNPYTKNPSDNKGRIEVLGFAADQNAPLGPCK